MSSNEQVYGQIKSQFAANGLDPEQDYYVVGGDYRDDCRAVWEDGGSWKVGSCERGSKHEDARFKSPFDAADYLAFLILAPALKNGKAVGFPRFDWS
jgi:hypothetical protein